MQGRSAFRGNDHEPVNIILGRGALVVAKDNELAVKRICRQQTLQVTQLLRGAAIDGDPKNLLLALVARHVSHPPAIRRTCRDAVIAAKGKLPAGASIQVNAKQITLSFGKLDLVNYQIIPANRWTESRQIGRKYHLLLRPVRVSHDKFKVMIGHDAAIRRPIDSPTFIFCAADLGRLIRRVLLRRHHPEPVGPILLNGGHCFPVGSSAEVCIVVTVQIIRDFVDLTGGIREIADLVLPF